MKSSVRGTWIAGMRRWKDLWPTALAKARGHGRCTEGGRSSGTSNTVLWSPPAVVLLCPPAALF